MPEVIMVASWRVMTVSSAALTRFGTSVMSVFRPRLLLVELHDLQAAGLAAPR